ncbi:hypothetical protein BC827DRAFT_1159259 [Russula dissimulans]|nr:hypothetical protein BC827DRAFT_1159259 [Russula dissimulans]
MAGDIKENISYGRKRLWAEEEDHCGKRRDEGWRAHPTYPTGWAGAFYASRTTPGLVVLLLATPARWIASGSTVFAYVLRIRTVRLRKIPPREHQAIGLLATEEVGVIWPHFHR